MDTGDNHSQDMFNILPPSLQSRMPDLLKRSFATLPLRRSRTTPPIPQRPSSSAGTASSYSDSDATLFSYSSSEASSTSARCSEQSVPPYSATSRDMSFTPPSEDQFAMDDPSSEYRRYPQLARLLQAAMEMDQSQSQSQNRMLELLQAQSRQPDPSFSHIARLPRDFNVSSHDAADQKWSPAGIKWRYARQGTYSGLYRQGLQHHPLPCPPLAYPFVGTTGTSRRTPPGHVTYQVSRAVFSPCPSPWS